MVNEVNFVRKCIATDTSQYDLWGKLVCTNFKISFITDDPMPLQVGYCSHGYIMNVISGIIHTGQVSDQQSSPRGGVLLELLMEGKETSK